MSPTLIGLLLGGALVIAVGVGCWLGSMTVGRLVAAERELRAFQPAPGATAPPDDQRHAYLLLEPVPGYADRWQVTTTAYADWRDAADHARLLAADVVEVPVIGSYAARLEQPASG